MPNSDIDSRLICYVFQNMADEAIDILEAKNYSRIFLKILVYWIAHSLYIGL